MKDVTIDFETYYDAEYSLRREENSSYVMDPRFEIIGVGVQIEHQAPVFFQGTAVQIKHQLNSLGLDWAGVRVIAHNARFDGSILEWRLGIKPGAYLCTMVGSRPHLAPLAGGQSLMQIARYLKIGAKGNYVEHASGKHRGDFSPEEMQAYANYCLTDVSLTSKIADYLVRILPVDEQKLIDLTLKKYLRPVLRINREKLVTRLAELEQLKAARLAMMQAKYGVTLEELRSRPKFAKRLDALLLPYGLTSPMKVSKTSKEGATVLTYAFAKDDREFTDLLLHPDQAIVDLVQAKLDVSSNAEDSRVARLIKIADLFNGYLPVPLVYYGAHTGRFSGDEKINLQNLPRVEYRNGQLFRGHLRCAIEAQSGYSIVAADLSNIEARIVATLAQQWDLVTAFREGRDIYSAFATLVYGRPIDKRNNPIERFVGKTCILGLGYGMGFAKFYNKMRQEKVVMSEPDARSTVYLYRNTYDCIPQLWELFDHAGRKVMTDPSGLLPWRGLTFAHDRIILPNNMPMMYPDLQWDRLGRGLTFSGRLWNKKGVEGEPTDAMKSKTVGRVAIWGGGFTENVAQAIARIIVTRAELKLAEMGLFAALQCHDELVFHVPTETVPLVKRAVAAVMTEVVPFMPDLPVAVEVHDGPTYGEAK